MSVARTIDSMPRKPKNTDQPGDGKKKPNRSPSYALFTRIELDLAEALRLYLESSDVQPTLSAVTKAAIKEFLTTRGFWPLKGKSADGLP